ncbi:MAG: T9SS type A sorting domain-containing protein, partial [Chitinophagales bacterium]
YVVQYTNQGGGVFNSFDKLLPGPVQRSPFLQPSNPFSETITLTPDEELKINFAWVNGEECTLDSADADAICDDKNTSNPNDDTYNIRYSATGQGAFSISGDLTVNNQEYPNNRLFPAESSYYSYPSFNTYSKWFEAELNLPVSGATANTLTFKNDATFPNIDCSETIVVPAISYCSQSIDIELDFAIDNIAPAINEGATITLTVTNTGSATAEDVEVELYLPDGGFPGDKFDNQVATPSQGNYEVAVQIWSVGNIGAGQTATLELLTSTPQLIEGQTIPLFAQVTRAHGYDPDSDVNNDTDQTADEDDEGFILFGDNRKVDFELVDFYPLQASYDEGELVEFYMEVRNSSDAEIEMDGATISIDLPSDFTFNSFEFADCQGNCFYSAPAQGINGMTFFNLMPGESTSTVIRYSNTGFTGGLDVFAQVASQVQGDIDSTPDNGICCTAQEDDEAFAQVEITGDTNPIDGVDLELQYEAASPTFNRWTKVDFTITATNAGTETATNVVVSTPIPTGLAFTSRELSKGSFNLYFQTWTIPDLAAGETATLDLTLFALATSAVTNFAQVKSLDQTDVDSSPDNNAGTIPQEDDEAAVTISPNGSSGGKNALEDPIDQSSTLALYQLFPVPALDNLQVVFGTAGHQVNLFLYDVHGKLLKQESLQVMRGENAIEVDVRALTAGFYTVSIETPEGFVRGKFLKQ